MEVTLPNGKVLVAGGIDSHNHALTSAELFDPHTGKWSVTGKMHDGRSNGTLTLLANGKVLAAGGFTVFTPGGMRAELYDPATEKWARTASMSVFRANHTATLLTNGKVLVAGGATFDQTSAIASAELYDPVTGTWAPTAGMSTQRAGHAATRLASGQVLVSGGDHDAFFGAQGSAEIYDPQRGSWTVVGRMMTSRRLQTSTAFADGTVIVTGGNYGDDLGGAGGNPLAMTDRYDPATGRWSPVGDMQVVASGAPTVAGRSNHTATLLKDGRVLVAGGYGNVNYTTFTVFRTSELFDPITNTWTLAANMHVERGQHAAALLADGRALVVGGSTVRSVTASAEIFTPASRGTQDGLFKRADVRTPVHWSAPRASNVTQPWLAAGHSRPYSPNAIGHWKLTGSMHVTRAGANGFPAILLRSGEVLVEGCDLQLGRGGVTAELYDPASGKWSLTGSMHVPRCNHGAALLPDGRVLVAGGDSGNPVHATAEIYDPSTGKWSMTSHMESTRFLFALVTLADGRVIGPAGAAFGTIPRDSADLYDPATGTWTATPSLIISRYLYGYGVLLDGKVLVFGGWSQDMQWTASSELYDPAANVWTSTGASIGQPFLGVTLTNGDVLATVPSQLYRESAGTWTKTKTEMRIPRIDGTMTLLSDGRVLAAGGCTSCGNIGSAVAKSEVYDPATQRWSLDASLNVARTSQAAVRLPDGKVLVAGGLIGFRQIASAEVCTPAR